MDRAVSWFLGGGPIMPAIFVVGALLYSLIFERLVALYALVDPRDPSSGPGVPRTGSLLVIRGLVAAAPLLGLLGTVTGMIWSFEGLVGGVGSAGEVGRGIGEALRTTQYGLAVALPGVLLERVLSRRTAYLHLQAGGGR